MRELPRVFSHIRKHGMPLRKPKVFCLGSGHVIFFTNKLPFLMDRYFLLVNEWKRRGFNWSYDEFYFLNENKDLIKRYSDFINHDWKPTEEEIAISRARIQEKIAMKPNYYRWTKYEN